jgi:CHAT domain-containing protein
MSLWRVEDDATRRWMKTLYEGRLAGRSTADAVREASLSMIRANRAKGRTTHPFLWGGFVAEGDWR